MHRLDTTGLIEVDRDDKGAYYYADERQPAERDEGLGSSFAALEELPRDLEFRFHPFRYYVLYHIDRCLHLGIHPMQMLISVDRYPDLVDHKASAFQRWSSSADSWQAVNRWNDTAALAVAAEPHTYEMLFGIIKCSASAGMEHQREAIRLHGAEYGSALETIGKVRIEEIRQELCISAQRLDPNRTVHTILRLTDGDFRVKEVKGRLGGAMYLLAMAEMLRRSAEEAFAVELPEEDELGFGMAPLDAKEQSYGARRLLDASRSAKGEFLRQYGLDYGIRVRWYVEGETEFGALDSFLGRSAGIELVNLRGQVTAARGKGYAFADSLKSDLRSHIFSFVSHDSDRGDYRGPAEKAAEDDAICGRLFMSDPDFEFANFTRDELTCIAWNLAQQNGACPEEHATLAKAVAKASSGKELEEAAKRAVPALGRLVKGASWGKALMAFALDTPSMKAPDGATKLRPIMEAVTSALRALQADYYLTRKECKTDPVTGQMVKRDAPLV
jgi:hypothetical protein